VGSSLSAIDVTLSVRDLEFRKLSAGIARGIEGLKSFLGILAATLSVCTSAIACDGNAAAFAVLERTKTTRATYTIHIWNRVTNPNKPAFEEASAEFHKGDLHRIETPRDRVVADCRAKTGAHLSVETGEITEGPEIAAFACGINTNFPILSIEILPNVETKFGVAQRVRVTDKQNIREYSILENGALANTTYTENRVAGQVLVVAEATLIENSVPEDVMFDKASLGMRYLPTDVRR
jgi:hypothetical protein